MPAPDEFEVELTAMAHGGSALGRDKSRTVFIPYTIPGERVLARIVQNKGRVVFAEGIKLLDASADRVYPRCPHFGPGKCGRCQWQHIDYNAQAMLKQDVLADQLERIGGFSDAVLESALKPIISCPDEWAYNYHITMNVTPAGEIGYPAADGISTFIIEECHIIHPELLDLFYQLDLDFTGLTRLRLQIGTDGGRMMIMSVTDENNVPELQADIPASVNILLPDNEPVNLIGDVHTFYTVKDRVFRVTAGSEFRPTISQLGKLVDAVMDALQVSADQRVLDLYAGVGFFTAFIAPHVRLVTMIDSYPPAVTDADLNLTEFENVDVIEGSVEEVLPELEDRYDVALIDPPPSGLSVEALDALVALQLPRIVYVSSDPATLARDGKRLAVQGYQLQSVQPIDLAPQTYFIDAVAIFVR